MSIKKISFKFHIYNEKIITRILVPDGAGGH